MSTHEAARQAGRMLAVRMIQEFSEKDLLEECALESEFRAPGQPQRDIVSQYIAKLTDVEVAAGFTSILTYWLACICGGAGELNPQWMELLATHEPEEARTIWRAMIEASNAVRS